MKRIRLFYWRIFGRTMKASEVRLYPGIAKPVFLPVWDYRQVRRSRSLEIFLSATPKNKRANFQPVSCDVPQPRAFDRSPWMKRATRFSVHTGRISRDERPHCFSFFRTKATPGLLTWDLSASMVDFSFFMLWVF